MYEEFAEIYDAMMEEIPYEEWFERARKFLEEKNITEGRICELGCGTGTMTELFAGAGYDMIGVDLSADMLAQAVMKSENTGHDILYIQQDMTELELGTAVDAVISLCDSMNYLIEERDMKETFLRVYKTLEPGGYFLFDLKTAYCFREVLGNEVRVEQDENMTCIWENYFYEEEAVNEYSLTIFRRQPESHLFDRTEEVHVQRAYEIEEVRQWLAECGFCDIACYAADGRDGAGLCSGRWKSELSKCERVYFAARRSVMEGQV